MLHKELLDPATQKRREDRQQSFHTKKVAQDILNKWVFRTQDCGNHGGHEEGGWHMQRGGYCDPLVPSYANLPTLEQYVRRQLYAVRHTLLGGDVTDEELNDFVFEVIISSIRAH